MLPVPLLGANLVGFQGLVQNLSTTANTPANKLRAHRSSPLKWTNESVSGLMKAGTLINSLVFSRFSVVARNSFAAMFR